MLSHHSRSRLKMINKGSRVKGSSNCLRRLTEKIKRLRLSKSKMRSYNRRCLGSKRHLRSTIQQRRYIMKTVRRNRIYRLMKRRSLHCNLEAPPYPNLLRVSILAARELLENSNIATQLTWVQIVKMFSLWRARTVDYQANERFPRQNLCQNVKNQLSLYSEPTQASLPQGQGSNPKSNL
jgi:hypothetical protein